jgi:hypothetical protein
MPKTLSTMTADELTDLIDARVERKLDEILRDPDAGLEIQGPLRRRLLEQRQRVAEGERGRPLDDVLAELGLD